MEFLPEKIGDYRVTDTMDYVGEALFDYINGGAELYLSYGLKGMTGCKYNGEGLPQITVEIYEMSSSGNAFGVYTQSRDKEEYTYGQGSQSFKDFILFWKDRYYVLVTSQKATAESEKTMQLIAETIDQSIENEGIIPEIVSALPQKNLVPAGFLYFHHYVWLNAYLFIADYNLLNINDSTDAVLAKYGNADERCYLLIVDYQDSVETEKAFQQLTEKFAPEKKSPHPTLQLEDGTWFSAWTAGKRLYAVFEGRNEAQIESIYNSVLTK
ncbi:MAG: hypothetical protein LBE91_18515 [Tannerella sp.]|jgi:hypothetical protein|nr:hypothetical protein [Tannerella sp.]